MQDLIGRLREYASIRKGELAELVTEAADALERQTCEDAVSRQAAIDALTEYGNGRTVYIGVEEAVRRIKQLPSVQPERKTDEWCSDCKEYDSEKHCCPRFNRVIRQTLSEQRKTGKWTRDNACPFCGFQPWYERDIHTLSFCPNCGADMRGVETDE